MELNIDPDWLLKMAEKEDGCIVSAGGFFTRGVIQSGCAVFHEPTQEEWFVLGVDRKNEKLCVAGYPPTIAYVSDCKLVDDQQRRELTEDEIRYRDTEFGSGWL